MIVYITKIESQFDLVDLIMNIFTIVVNTCTFLCCVSPIYINGNMPQTSTDRTIWTYCMKNMNHITVRTNRCLY